MPSILNPRSGLRVRSVARRVDGSSERNGFAEFTSGDFPALEVLHEIRDELFHAVILPDVDCFEIVDDPLTLALCRDTRNKP